MSYMDFLSAQPAARPLFDLAPELPEGFEVLRPMRRKDTVWYRLTRNGRLVGKYQCRTEAVKMARILSRMSEE